MSPNPYLSSELCEWQARVTAFVQQELVPVSDQVEREAAIPEEVVQRVREMGLFGTHTPREFGGMGLSMLGSCISIEALAAAHIAFYYTSGVNVHIGSKAIEIAGTEEQKRAYLPRLASGEFIAALAMTEPDAGSDAASISTEAVRRGSGYALNGKKIFITNAQIADCFTVIARTDASGGRNGLSAFIVPRGTKGLRIGPAMEMLGGAGSFHNEVVFEDCAVPASALIGAEGRGFELAMRCLDHGRLHWAAYGVGLAQAMLDLAVRRVDTRKQFGHSLSQNQAVRWELADLATEVHSGRLMAYDAAWRFDNDPANASAWAAMAKLANGDMVFRVADRVLQLFGGYGYCKSYPIERMWRESRVVRILDGTSQMMKQIVGKEVLRGTFGATRQEPSS
jgi:alkylation response protein AidB-like acyl-CoA dehydrogenase